MTLPEVLIAMVMTPAIVMVIVTTIAVQGITTFLPSDVDPAEPGADPAGRAEPTEPTNGHDPGAKPRSGAVRSGA